MNNRIDELSPELLQKISLAAELYYIYNMTQNEIAKQMGVSRVWISKLLKKAEDYGIVKIDVATYSAGVKEVEQKLIEKYHLKNAKVVKTTNKDQSLIYCGRAASNYLISVIRRNDRIGIFWGTTLAAMVQQFIPLEFPNVTVIPLVGGIGTNPALLCNQIAMNLAQALGAKCHPLHSPGFVAGKEERDLLLRDPTIRTAIDISENVDIAIFGMGALRNTTITTANCITEQEFDGLEKAGAVGDLCLHFLNQEGQIVPNPIHDRLVSGDLRIICQRAREVMGIAYGEAKVPIIRASLNNHWLDSFFTDYDTATMLLDDEPVL